MSGHDIRKKFGNGFVEKKYAFDENAEMFQVEPIKYRDRVFYDIDTSRKHYANFDEVNKRLWRTYDVRKQRLHEIAYKKRIWEILSEVSKSVFPNGYLALGGSTVNHFGTHASDLDLCFALRCGKNDIYDEDIAFYVLTVLKSAYEEQPYIRTIRMVYARVPILKIEMNFPYNDFEVDINCNCVAGIFNSHLLCYYGMIDERVTALATYLKDWGAECQVIDPRFGGINSYTMVLMVVHFLQCGVDPPILPNLISMFPQMFDGLGNVENLVFDEVLPIPEIKRNTRSLAEMMYGFLNYYQQFDYDNYGISIREAKLFNRSERPKDDMRFLFFIEEAYDGLTVPKNLVRRHRLDAMVLAFGEARDYLLMDLVGGVPRHLMTKNSVLNANVVLKGDEDDEY